MPIHLKKIIAVSILVFLLASCAKPLDDDKLPYVGLWKSHQTSLLITQSGMLEYETKKGAVTTSVSMPIKHIDNAVIEARFLFMSSSFQLDGAPKDEDGMLMLVVDGEKLYKTDELGRLPQATVVPPLDELRVLAMKELTLLAKGINNNDFSEYLDNSSLVFQSQFTNEKLLETYGGFIDQEINIEEWMQGEFLLTAEPSVDENGVLEIDGAFPTSPNSLKFSLSFVYTHPNWKSLGGNININSE